MLKVGDTVKIFDGSYAFGVKDGDYDRLNSCSQKGPFTVIAVNLKTTIDADLRMSYTYNHQPAIADILIGDNDGGFWFVPSCMTEPVQHTITFDNGKAIKISKKSYNALKNQLS